MNRRRLRAALALTLLACLAPASLCAQLDSLTGRRIRVRHVGLPDSTPYRFGTLVRLTSDTLVFRRRVEGEASIALPLESVRRLDVSLGRPSNARNILIGAAVGYALFAGAAHVLGEYGQAFCEGDGCIPSRKREVTSILVWGIPGAMLGGLVGAHFQRREQWRSVPLPAR